MKPRNNEYHNERRWILLLKIFKNITEEYSNQLIEINLKQIRNQMKN